MLIKHVATRAYSMVCSTYPGKDWDVEVCVHPDGTVAVFPGENADDGDSAALVKSDGTVELLGSSPVDLTAFVGECPIVCVRRLGLQVVRESVGVSHG